MSDHTPTTRVMQGDADHLLTLVSLFKKYNRVIEPRIQGHSMALTIPTGARIRLQCGDERLYDRGMIVVFLRANQLIVHRIVHCPRSRRAKQYLLTQGDGMLLPDAPVPVSTVVGTVTAVEYANGWQTPVVPATPSRPRWLVMVMARALLCSALWLNMRLACWLSRMMRSVIPLLQFPAGRWVPSVHRSGERHSQHRAAARSTPRRAAGE